MSKKHPTLGYKKVTKLLRDDGWLVNKKQVQRIRREEGLQVPPKKPRIRRQGLSTGLPQQAKHRNHVWAWDWALVVMSPFGLGTSATIPSAAASCVPST